jgi:N-acetylmuramoyl-L-alanine amidase
MNKPQKIIVHHSGGSNANPLADSSNFTFEQCNELHKKNFNFISSLGFYVGYHYYVSKDGTIKQARLDTDAGAHTIGHNKDSLGICLAGNFDATLPTEAQIATLTKFLKEKCLQYNIQKENIYPHRKFAIKTCYGMKLSDTWAANLLNTEQTPMTQVEVTKLYALTFSRVPDLDELNFWTGKALIDFLNEAIKNRATFLGLQ